MVSNFENAWCRAAVRAVLGALGCFSLACGEVPPPSTISGGTAGTGAGAASGTGASGGSAGIGTGGGAGSTGGGSVGGSAGSTGGGAGSGAAGSGSGGSSGGMAGMPPVGGELADCPTPGPRLIRRLTPIQFRNTLVDVFQDGSVPAAEVLSDPSVLRFRVDADTPVIRDLDAALLMDYAETVAAWVVDSKLSALSSCRSNDQGCTRSFIESLGRKLYREPLSEPQIAAYQALFTAETAFEDGAEVAIMAMLQSPYLLYRRELGTPDSAAPGEFVLTPYEVASQLSYFITGSAPDQSLLAAAAEGRLVTQADIDREAERLLGTELARESLKRFVASWFELDGLPQKAKDDSVFPLGASMRSSMIGESQAFFVDAFYSNATIGSLFAAEHSFVNGELAGLYGLPGGGDGFSRVELGSSNRARGLLGQAAFLTAHSQPENSSPVQRGRFVRDRILCEGIPEIPADLNTNLANGASFATNRERYVQHAQDGACVGCHLKFDPVGFAFEHFDGVGRYRDQENGNPIDATGTLIEPPGDNGLPAADVPLDGAESLIDYLADNEHVRACFVRYLSYYAHGRDNWSEKKCNDDSVRREARDNGNTIRSVLFGILHAPTFTRRTQDP
jgi:hypothetical protein